MAAAWGSGSHKFTGARVRIPLKVAFLLPLALALHATRVDAQTDSLIEREITSARDASHWQLGSLWLTPQITLQGIYDTNPTNSPVASETDIAGAVTPKLSAWVPVGARVIFDVSE